MQQSISIDAVRPDEVELLLELIGELADYERLADQAVADAATVHQLLHAESPRVFAALARLDGEVAGMCVYFFNFSTFLGRHGLYLEDLFVRPTFRGRGVGLALMRWLAGVAVANDCGRFEWSVLDWNESAHGFYQTLGAVPMEGWTTWRLSGEDLVRLAAKETGMNPGGVA